MSAPRRRVRLVATLAVALAAVLVGCGIATEPDADRIEPSDVPFGLLEANPTTTEVAAGRTASVYLLAEDRLVAVDRSVPDEAELADLVELLVTGPTEVERSLGITTAVPPGAVAAVSSGGGAAQVELATSFGDIRSGDQILALGQIVYTLTNQPGIGGVEFTLDGTPVEVPLADGSRSDGPLSRDDFEALAPA